jgi:hypothetical protein
MLTFLRKAVHVYVSVPLTARRCWPALRSGRPSSGVQSDEGLRKQGEYGMKFKLCQWSFFSGMLVPVLLGAFIIAQSPKSKPTTPAPTSIIHSSDYERITALIARLEAWEAQRTTSQPPVPNTSTSDTHAEFRQASPSPRPTVTARTPPVPKNTHPDEFDQAWEAVFGSHAPAAPTYTLPARTAENGSYYRQLNANGVPKTVYVKGYYRRDGTYVRGHYRSAPGSNPR